MGARGLGVLIRLVVAGAVEEYFYFHRAAIEDLNLRPAVKKAIVLLLYQTNIKVLKDALAC